MAEDVEGVVAVVGEGERVDDGVEVDDVEGEEGEAQEDGGSREAGARVGGEGAKLGEEGGPGEENDEGEEVEELWNVEGGDVVGLVSCSNVSIGRVGMVNDIPSTTPPFQVTKPAKATSSDS